jgi:hypothetical protein
MGCVSIPSWILRVFQGKAGPENVFEKSLQERRMVPCQRGIEIPMAVPSASRPAGLPKQVGPRLSRNPPASAVVGIRVWRPQYGALHAGSHSGFGISIGHCVK